MPDASPWLRPSDPNAVFRLVCLPYAGGTTADYWSWRDGFPADVEVAPVTIPGRERRLRDPLYTDLKTLARDLARDLAPVLRSAPFALYGHSLGSWVAFELARELRRTGLPQPEHLFVSARRAPQEPSTHPPLYQLPRDRFLEELQARYNAIPEKILNHREILDMFLPGLRADYTMLDTYVYAEEPPLDLPITAFRGVDDPMVTAEQMQPWANHTTRAFSLRTLPGGHFFLRDSRHLLTSAIHGLLGANF